MLPWLDFFLKAQVLAAAGAFLGWGLRRFARTGKIPLSPGEELRLHYGLLVLLGALLLIPTEYKKDFSFHPVAHVEFAPRSSRSVHAESAPVVVLPGKTYQSRVYPLQAFAWGALAIALLGFFAVALDYLRLAVLLRRAVSFRSIGRVRIAVAEGLESPLSARGLRCAWVIVPPAFLENPLARRVAIAHELQHHRAGDALWCHALAPLRVLCFFHLLRALWFAAIAEAQELACDEVLVSQKVSAGDYSRCLVDAAETAVRRRAGRPYAAALSLFSDRRLLARRIESMYIQHKRKNRLVTLALGLVAGSCLAASAWASGHWVIDSRVSGRKMVEMAEVARRGSDFPIVVNDAVLRELNHFLGTASGREFVDRALENLERMRPILTRELAEHHVPEELLAVGLIESGFRNLPESANPKAHGAGVWQFIPSTARKFGLKVDEETDERLDIPRETDAAFRYLAANQLLFQDWLLGVMAYNTGERAVGDAILKFGTRDPWKLVQLGFENDHAYLAKFMAAVLILKNRGAPRASHSN